MKKGMKYLRSLLKIGVVVLVLFALFTQGIRPITIVGSSMYPTLANNDRGVINSLVLTKSTIERFDVVVLDWQENNERIIKRVIGLPGDHIEYKEDELYINGILYEEPFLNRDYMAEAKQVKGVDRFTEDFVYDVPNDGYFVLGDNRLNSLDSREMGCFKMDDIVGKAGYLIYPFSHFGMIK